MKILCDCLPGQMKELGLFTPAADAPAPSGDWEAEEEKPSPYPPKPPSLTLISFHTSLFQRSPPATQDPRQDRFPLYGSSFQACPRPATRALAQGLPRDPQGQGPAAAQAPRPRRRLSQGGPDAQEAGGGPGGDGLLLGPATRLPIQGSASLGMMMIECGY